jgi:Icc-related predicted phosphoesterase
LHRRLSHFPATDIFIHAGDITKHGTEAEVQDFLLWMSELPCQYKIFIAGNHDLYDKTQAEIQQILPPDTFYLCDSGVEIEGIKFWGSPVTVLFHNHWAFSCTRGEEMRAHWAKIPADTDVLITHSPPFNILDLEKSGEHIGCRNLLQTVQAVKPCYHLFGHVHESYGIEQQGETTFINGSALNENHKIAVFSFSQHQIGEEKSLCRVN